MMLAVEFLIGVLFLTSLIHCGCSSSPTTFVLERISSTSNEGSIDIIAKDRIRHHHMFQSSLINGVVNYPVLGSSDPVPYGYYFTKVKLGNPPREYHLLIDTGSDITWVRCNPGAGIATSFFDPHTSYSAEPVSCSGHICKSVAQTHRCSSNGVCSYSIPYQDTSSTSGYFVADSFHFDIMGNSATSNYSTTIIFGCSTNMSGTLINPRYAFDGILGLGNQRISVISQLASRGLTPDVFSHCLKGEGGGTLVFGEIVEPGIVYTPLVPSQPHYYLNLQSISIGGKTVPIDRRVFATSRNQGTVVDSGTTHAYLAEGAYDPFVTALVAAVPPSEISFSYQAKQCFHVSNSLRGVFPLVSLNFAGGASMVLKPEEYLIEKRDAGPGVWCVGFHRNQGLTILGELVLKDKIIVYDLAQQRLGWAEYDCLSSVNVSLVPPRVSSSSRAAILYMFFTGSLCMILILLAFC